MVVVCFSEEYAKGEWTLTEWEAIRANNMKLRARGDLDRCVPLRVGEGSLPGLPENTIWADARRGLPRKFALDLVKRLRRFVPNAGRPKAFLAEVTPEAVNWATALPKSHPGKLQAIRLWLEQEPGPLAEGEAERSDRRNLKLLLSELDIPNLIEILKWPYSVSGAQDLVLAELELKLSKPEIGKYVKFNGKLENLLNQAPSLEIEGLEDPVQPLRGMKDGPQDQFSPVPWPPFEKHP